MKPFSLFALAGLALAQSNDTSMMNLTAVISNNTELSSLAGLLELNSALLSTLSSATNITVLAPDNSALGAFLNSTANGTSSANNTLASLNAGDVTALLTYHVLNGTHNSSTITSTPAFIPTFLTNTSYANVTGGQRVEAVNMDNNVTFISGLRSMSHVVTADIAFNGGIIHVIDKVLTIPMNLTDTAVEGNLSAAAGAITAAGLGATLDDMTNITVFAPNNNAFSSISSILSNLSTTDLRNILEYHVVEGVVGYSSTLMNETLTAADGQSLNISVIGNDTFVNAARVVVPDVLIANGVLHVIDSVLNPNATGNATTPNTSTTVPAFPGASSASGTAGNLPFTSNVPAPTGTGAGNVQTTSSEQIAPQMTAAVALGALFGGAAVMMNNL